MIFGEAGCLAQSHLTPVAYNGGALSDASDLVGIEYENVSYNIFCNHGKFDYPQMSKVMGSREKTKYITMIRDPVELFISAWYYSIHKGYKMTLGIYE